MEINAESDGTKVATLLKSVGTKAYAMIHSICSPELPSKKTYEQLCEIMVSNFTPPIIVFHERKMFHDAKMQEGETVVAWHARVKKLAMNCKFGAALDNHVLDKFVVELPPKVFEKICEEDETFTLDKALKKAILHEQKIAQKSTTEVNYVKPRVRNNGKGNSSQAKSKKSNNNYNKSNGTSQSKKTTCTHCGWRNHESKDCHY